MQNIIFILLLSVVIADPFFTSLLYQDVSNQYCTRYYHRTGGVGCRTPLSGVHGIAIPVEEANDIQKYLAGKNEDVVLIMRSSILSKSVILEAVSYKTVVGLIVCGNETSVEGFSPFSSRPDGADTPSANITLHPDYVWNPTGSGLFYLDLPMAMSHVTDLATIALLFEKASNNVNGNNRNPFIVDMNSYMGPDEMDSPTCIRRGNCQPIGGQSVWASETPIHSERPVVLVAAQMDDASLFYEDSNGRTAITESVLLAVVQAIRALPGNRSNQLLVAFFQGESWGRGGSRRWVGDIASFTCEQEVSREDSPFTDRICTSPLKLSLHFRDLSLARFKQVFILDQLLPSSQLFLHREADAVSLDLSPSILPASSLGLPPGPSQTFYEAGVRDVYVISGYDQTFAPGYGSSLPDAVDLNQAVAVANTLAREIVMLLEPADLSPSVQVNATYLDGLLACLQRDGSCGSLETTLNMEPGTLTKRLHNRPLSLYAGPYSAGRYPLFSPEGKSYTVNYTGPVNPKKDGIYFTPSVLESFIQGELTLSFYQNATTIPCSSWKDCRSLENGLCVAGRCFASNAYFHDAVDPAFEVVGSNSYRINMTVPSPLYTEPYWGGYYGSNPSVKVYQKVATWVEWVTLVVGILLCCVTYYFTQALYSVYGLQLKLNK